MLGFLWNHVWLPVPVCRIPLLSPHKQQGNLGWSDRWMCWICSSFSPPLIWRLLWEGRARSGKYISYLELSQNWEPKTLSHGLKHQYLLAIFFGVHLTLLDLEICFTDHGHRRYIYIYMHIWTDWLMNRGRPISTLRQTDLPGFHKGCVFTCAAAREAALEMPVAWF